MALELDRGERGAIAAAVAAERAVKAMSTQPSARPIAAAQRLVRRYPLGVLGAVLLAVVALAAAFAPLIAPHSPTAFLRVGPYAAPGHGALLGTDQIGRDMLSRILYGARTSLLIAASAAALGVGIGALVGLLSGYAGGRVDLVVQRLVEVMDAFPSLVLALLFVALLGPSSFHVTLAVAIVLVPGVNRVVRALTLGLRAQPFVEAARSIGAPPVRVLLRDVAPGLVGTVAIVAANAMAGTIVTEASLSFLGLGPPPPAATLGQMLAGEVRQHFVDDPWLAIMPGLAIALCIFAVTMLGDSLRDAFDPRHGN